MDPQHKPGAALVDAATVGFKSLNELSRSTKIPLNTLHAIKNGTSNSSAGTRMLLAILADNPRQAWKACSNASAWLIESGLGMKSRVGATVWSSGSVAPRDLNDTQQTAGALLNLKRNRVRRLGDRTEID